MSRDDWYRHTSWSAADRAAFYARLERSRSDDNKAQALRSQALHLQETGDRALLPAALELLDEALARFPAHFAPALTHQQRAAICDALDRPADAIDSFRAGVAAQRAFPNAVTRVALAFGMFCLRRNLVDLLPEAEQYVTELARPSPFPRDVYEANAILAIAAAQRGDDQTARACAAGALDAAARESSGIAGHTQLGLVASVEPTLLARLRALSAGC